MLGSNRDGVEASGKSIYVKVKAGKCGGATGVEWRSVGSVGTYIYE
jgi:hypothetical protein